MKMDPEMGDRRRQRGQFFEEEPLQYQYVVLTLLAAMPPVQLGPAGGSSG